MSLSKNLWDIACEPTMRGYTIEWMEPDYFILSRREVLYEARSLHERLVKIGTYPRAFWKNSAARFRPFQRLLRHLYYNVLKLPDGSLFLTFGRSIGIYAHGSVHTINGFIRPSRILRSGCAMDKNGIVFLGEYLNNPERSPIRVYRYIPGSTRLEVVYTFQAGAIRHVHGIYRDPYTEDLWCVTGDRGSECRILRTIDDFRHLETVGEGDESWRCVSLLFSRDAIYYATDSEFQQNRIYRIDRETGKRNELGNIDGPVYYSYRLNNDLFFGVTAELCPGQKGSTHKGRSASLWHIDKDDKIQKLLSFEKDTLPVKYFMPGTLHFPRGPGLTGRFYVHCVGLKDVDNLTSRIEKKVGE